SAAAGNASTRIEAFVISTGIRSYGGYPEIDGLFRDQAAETDKKRREGMLNRIQQLMHDKAMFAPIVEPALLVGVGSALARAPRGAADDHRASVPVAVRGSEAQVALRTVLDQEVRHGTDDEGVVRGSRPRGRGLRAARDQGGGAGSWPSGGRCEGRRHQSRRA